MMYNLNYEDGTAILGSSAHALSPAKEGKGPY